MKTAIVYYSYNGHTRKKAQAMAQQQGCALVEAEEIKRPSTLKAYVAGCLAAIRQKRWDVVVDPSIQDFDQLVVMGPVWAGYAAPQVNSIIDQLPSGSRLDIKLVSASGKSAGEDALIKRAQQHGLDVTSFEDIKS